VEDQRERFDERNWREELWWYYLDTRRFGSAVHSGFGFERLVLFCNWNDEHTTWFLSKNTIERRVLIFTKVFTKKKFYQKSSKHFVLKYFATKSKGAKKSCSYYSNKSNL
jgi:hypothetical protein